MFPFELSIFGTGLIVMVAVLMALYLIVLTKLNPSTEGERIPKKDVSKQRILEETLTERQVKPTMFGKVERREPRVPVPVDTEKTAVQGCPHYFGYLREHPKNTPIPNECLTCTKIMECLSKTE